MISNAYFKRKYDKVISTVRVGAGEYVGIIHSGTDGKKMEGCDNGFGTDEV
jgi:hypothetical protein